jgi:hypothetical protein
MEKAIYRKILIKELLSKKIEISPNIQKRGRKVVRYKPW